MSTSVEGGEPTNLELIFLAEAHRRYSHFGVPGPRQIKVLRRDIDSAGRFVRLSHSGVVDIADSVVFLAQVELGGGNRLVLGNLHISARSLVLLQLLSVGDEPWSGEELEPMRVFRD